MVQLRFSSYERDILKTLPESELRAEYRRLQKIANKRLKNLGQSEFNRSNVYLENRKKFRNVSTIKRKSDLTRLLSDLGGFVGSKTSSVRGLQSARRKSIQTLKSQGITWVNAKNYNAWIETIRYIKEHSSRQYYPTNEVMRQMTKEVQKGAAVEQAYKKFIQMQ